MHLDISLSFVVQDEALGFGGRPILDEDTSFAYVFTSPEDAACFVERLGEEDDEFTARLASTIRRKWDQFVEMALEQDRRHEIARARRRKDQAASRSD